MLIEFVIFGFLFVFLKNAGLGSVTLAPSAIFYHCETKCKQMREKNITHLAVYLRDSACPWVTGLRRLHNIGPVCLPNTTASTNHKERGFEDIPYENMDFWTCMHPGRKRKCAYCENTYNRTIFS